MRQSRTVREGYLGLFSLVGLVVFGVLAFWLSGGEFGSQTYTVEVKFPNASGIKEGAAVNYRGVLVGVVSKINPQTSQVQVFLRIHEKAKIPVGSTIEVSRYGLLGEASIEITPANVAQNSIDKISPVSPTCDHKIIICNKSQVEGQAGTQVFANLSRLTEAFTNPVFLERINTTVKNLALLSEELAKTSKTLDKNLNQISAEAVNTARSINKTARDASLVSQTFNNLLLENRTSINQTIGETKELIVSLNGVIKENRANISQSIISVQKTGIRINELADEIETTVKQADKFLNSPKSALILDNLNKVLANAAETSQNLKEISKTFNDPKTILTLQKTLESARSTFENTQKITSDLDDLTGDPAFRENLRRLVKGLGSIVSTTDQLEQQVRLSQALESTRLSLETSKNIPPLANSLKP